MEDSPLPLGVCSTLSEKNRGLISNVNLSGFSSPASGSCSVFLQYIAEPQTLQYAVPFSHALTSITDPFVLCIRASGKAIPPLPGRGSALFLPRRSWAFAVHLSPPAPTSRGPVGRGGCLSPSLLKGEITVILSLTNRGWFL